MSLLNVLMSPQGIRRHNEGVLSKCKEGDLLQFYRTGYSHWAVYVGNGRVIHRAENNGGNCKVKIREDYFWTVATSSLVKINNYLDKVKAALPGWQVVQRARSKLGTTGYNLMFRNCEHFASWCRYGVRYSGQVLAAVSLSTGLTTAGVATGNLPLVAAGVGLGVLMAVINKGSKMCL